MRILVLAALTLSGCAASTSAFVPAAAEDLGDAHPLNGKVFDARIGRFITDTEALDAARSARFLLLGEKHDNPAHHAGQARLLAARAESASPALVWEMIHREQRFEGPVVSGTADDFATELGWAESGWPDFGMYRPIAQAAIAAGIEHYAGNLEPVAMRTAYREGLEGLGSERARALGVQTLLEGEDLEELRAEIERGHCGFGDDAMLDSMAAAQQSRDAFMAQQLVEHERDGAVLIAGGGHVRRNRAVPFHLVARDGVEPEDILVVTWVEVRDGEDDPLDYVGGEPAAYDLVFFTPRISNEDPCEKFAEQVERIRAQERKRSAPEE